MNDSDRLVEDERDRAVDEAYHSREHQWDDAWPTTDEETSAHLGDEVDVEDEDTPFPGVAGTSDAEEAVRDAEPYVPAIDPPVLPGGFEGIHEATGLGLSAEEEAARGPEPRGDYDIQDQVLLTLQQDSLTSHYDLHAHVRNGVVHLTGRIPSLDDAEYAMALVGELAGVVDVIDDTTLDPNMNQ